MTFLGQKNWRGEFTYQGVSYGYWNSDDITFSSESTSITDPEDGPQIVGGVQTAEDLTIRRPWKLTRDSVVYSTLKPLRGRGGGEFIIHELDPVTGQPVRSEPLDVLKVQAKELVKPGGDVEGSEKSEIQIGLTVQP